jgi:hypothetical protein
MEAKKESSVDEWTFNRQSASHDGLCVNLKAPSCSSSDQCQKYLLHGVYISSGLRLLRHRPSIRAAYSPCFGFARPPALPPEWSE